MIRTDTSILERLRPSSVWRSKSAKLCVEMSYENAHRDGISFDTEIEEAVCSRTAQWGHLVMESAT